MAHAAETGAINRMHFPYWHRFFVPCVSGMEISDTENKQNKQKQK